MGLQISASPWKYVMSGITRRDASASGTLGMNEFGGASFGGAGGGYSVFYLDPANGGNCQLEMVVATNAVAPGCDLSIELAPISASAGGAATVSVTDGTVVTGGTVTLTTPAATSQLRATTTFACPAAGYYALRLRIASPGMSASSSASVRAFLRQR